ncbi:MAG: hemin uptake protein HemP [Burkholderiales bacterium]|nr:hemin uptake protein HemP [Burkholderiales bacterium]
MDKQPAALPARPAPAVPAAPRAVTSTELLQGGRMVEIRHNGETYRLQATRLGKLILTK